MIVKNSLSPTEFDRAKYAQLLAEVLPKPITNEVENEHYLAVIAQLMDKECSMEESLLLGLLITMVEEFEDKHYQMTNVNGLVVLKSLMADHGMEQKDLATLLGSASRASEILAGKRPISKGQAKILGDRFGLDYGVFLEFD